MTNYNLPEFKTWLNNQPERTLSLWTHLTEPNYSLEKLVKAAQGNATSPEAWTSDIHQPYREVVLRWLRERERENNMINAQTWLQEKFPTRENKEALKILAISNSGGTPINTNLTSEELHSVVLEGEMNLNDFPNLEMLVLSANLSQKVTIIKAERLTKVNHIHLNNCSELTWADFSHCEQLSKILVRNCPNLKFFSFLESCKTEMESLKNQIAQLDGSAAEVVSDSEESLTSKITRKKSELESLRTGSRKTTAPLRKQIELLERVQTLEQQVNQLQQRETQYQQQLQTKEQQITQKQTEINTLNQTKNQNQTRITQLQQQITNLTTEKNALTERMLRERQQALNQFNQEKTQLTQQITQLTEQKDTFQKSADYLRETLKGTESELERVKRELSQSQTDQQTTESNHQQSLTEKNEELKQRSEAFKVIQERNSDLTNKLSLSQQEIAKLSEWISKLESVSGEGDAFSELKKELDSAQALNKSLQEQLNSKQPKSYWWVYLLIALVGIYLILKGNN